MDSGINLEHLLSLISFCTGILLKQFYYIDGKNIRSDKQIIGCILHIVN
jgi:hypothetical protein